MGKSWENFGKILGNSCEKPLLKRKFDLKK
nr:MAG TPA: hypothetical protein [Caudoviricetes sp.]